MIGALTAVAQAGGIDDPAPDVSATVGRVLQARPDARAARNRTSEAELKYRLASDFFSPSVWKARQAVPEVESAHTGVEMSKTRQSLTCGSRSRPWSRHRNVTR